MKTWWPYTFSWVNKTAKLNVTLIPFNWYGCGIWLNVNTNVSGMKRENWTGTFYSELNSWDNVKLLVMAWDTGRNPSYQINKLELIINMYKWINIPWKPRELQSISNKATITIFWVHTDNTRVTQD